MEALKEAKAFEFEGIVIGKGTEPVSAIWEAIRIPQLEIFTMRFEIATEIDEVLKST